MPVPMSPEKCSLSCDYREKNVCPVIHPLKNSLLAYEVSESPFMEISDNCPAGATRKVFDQYVIIEVPQTDESPNREIYVPYIPHYARILTQDDLNQITDSGTDTF